jgi:hypothetical protein
MSAPEVQLTADHNRAYTLGDGGGFLTPLQRERYARDWTQQEAIDRLKRLAHERGYGQRFDG